ncbi:hypothetical protein J6590_021494 [Homalodisca vitripennis]|nr:hypothetical protein J6590_021494 [Homalodisca vitripennis]
MFSQKCRLVHECLVIEEETLDRTALADSGTGKTISVISLDSSARGLEIELNSKTNTREKLDLFVYPYACGQTIPLSAVGHPRPITRRFQLT